LDYRLSPPGFDGGFDTILANCQQAGPLPGTFGIVNSGVSKLK